MLCVVSFVISLSCSPVCRYTCILFVSLCCHYDGEWIEITTNDAQFFFPPKEWFVGIEMRMMLALHVTGGSRWDHKRRCFGRITTAIQPKQRKALWLTVQYRDWQRYTVGISLYSSPATVRRNGISVWDYSCVYTRYNVAADTSSKQCSTRGYKWIQHVSGLHVSGVNAA